MRSTPERAQSYGKSQEYETVSRCDGARISSQSEQHRSVRDTDISTYRRTCVPLPYRGDDEVLVNVQVRNHD